MDATQRLRERVHSLLVRGLASREVTAVLGIEGASEVWGGAAPLDRPAWYLWLRGAPGAYRLGLEEAGCTAPGIAAGRFSIRYYPAPAEPSFATFSVEERTFVERGFLDATGTPRVDRAHEIPDDLFGVGLLEYRLGPGEAAEISFASMDRLRVRYDEDAALRYEPLGIVIAHSRGELARDVPGWRLGAKLFRCVAGLHAHLEGRAPIAVAVERQPGTEFVRRGGAFEWLSTDASLVGEASARFGPEVGGATGAVRGACAELPLELEAEWWALAAAPHRHDAPSCGCGCGGVDRPGVTRGRAAPARSRRGRPPAGNGRGAR